MSDTNLRETAQIKRLKAIVSDETKSKDQRHRAAMRIIRLTEAYERSQDDGASSGTSESLGATEMRNTRVSGEQAEIAERTRRLATMFDQALEEERAVERAKPKAPAPIAVKVDEPDQSEPMPEPEPVPHGLTKAQLDRLSEYRLAQLQ